MGCTLWQQNNPDISRNYLHSTGGGRKYDRGLMFQLKGQLLDRYEQFALIWKWHLCYSIISVLTSLRNCLQRNGPCSFWSLDFHFELRKPNSPIADKQANRITRWFRLQRRLRSFISQKWWETENWTREPKQRGQQKDNYSTQTCLIHCQHQTDSHEPPWPEAYVLWASPPGPTDRWLNQLKYTIF